MVKAEVHTVISNPRQGPPALLEKFGRISLYLTNDAILQSSMCRKVQSNREKKFSPIELSNSVINNIFIF